MSDRKVLNKYYHPEMFESKIPRRKAPKNNQTKIRGMVAMTIQCQVCGEYIFSAKKLNSRKEVIEGDNYLGMKNYRFYIRCTRCASELTFRTDYQHDRYVCEHNCKSLNDSKSGSSKSITNEDEEDDEMKLLERKTLSSRKEQEDTEHLEFIKERMEKRKAISPTIVKKESEGHNSKENEELLEFEEFQSQFKRKLHEENIEEDEIQDMEDHVDIEVSEPFIPDLLIQPKKKRKPEKKVIKSVKLNLEYND